MKFLLKVLQMLLLLNLCAEFFQRKMSRILQYLEMLMLSSMLRLVRMM